jgi:hypothetical protein
VVAPRCSVYAKPPTFPLRPQRLGTSAASDIPPANGGFELHQCHCPAVCRGVISRERRRVDRPRGLCRARRTCSPFLRIKSLRESATITWHRAVFSQFVTIGTFGSVSQRASRVSTSPCYYHGFLGTLSKRDVPRCLIQVPFERLQNLLGRSDERSRSPFISRYNSSVYTPIMGPHFVPKRFKLT